MGIVHKARVNARRAWPLVVVMTASILGMALWPYFTHNPNLGVQAKPRIQELMYPTFGNPAIVKKGEDLILEVDPRSRDFDQPFIALKSLDVTATTSIDPAPIDVDLPLHSIRTGNSTRWPEYAPGGRYERTIYLVTVRIPESMPVDLYDVNIVGKTIKGEDVDDYQPHALQAVDDYKSEYSFCQLTDIHNYGPECSYPSAVYHERSGRPNGITPGRNGSVYYRKTIDQINVMKPDFCVFTGDFMFGQSYFLKNQGWPWGVTTEYEYEMLWFYDETMALDVPVFMVMGNHEMFAEGGEGAGEDWFENWRRLFGPTYFSFDYGSSHFLMLNSQDWSRSMRTLEDLTVSIQSEKYKGQFRGGGDTWAPGVTPERLAAIDESGFTGQLRWMRDDLASHMSSSIRVVATHQDPWRKDGSGTMWASSGSDDRGVLGSIKAVMGFAGKYGNGEGRLAAIRLMSEYDVALELSGHFHSDHVEVLPWLDGNGEVLCVNTTCVQFNVAGLSRSYPGYRRIWIKDGVVESYNYKDPKWSYPIYAGVKIGGVTNLGELTEPAFTSELEPDSGRSREVTWTVNNTLIKPLPGAFTKIELPYLKNGRYYVVRNGRIRGVHDNDDDSPSRRVLDIVTNVPAKKKCVVEIAPSEKPDKTDPAGTVVISGGAPDTGTLDVILSLKATDAGGSGVKDVMVSNRSDFKGATWQPYVTTMRWRLAEGDAGERTVYARFRDNAMPANVSETAREGILFTPE